MKEKKKQKMPTDIKIFIVVAIIIAIGFTILVVSITKPKDVALVNKNTVTSDEFQYHLSQNISGILQYKDPSMDNATYLNSPYGSGTIMDLVKQQTLSQVVQIEILLLKAKEDGFKVLTQEIEAGWNLFRNSLLQNAEYSKMTLQEFCKAALGVSLNKTKRIYKNFIISQAYLQAKTEEVVVDEEKLSAFYEENKSYFDGAVIRHILVSSTDDETAAEKKKLAEDILEKVNNGEDFTTLAAEYSEDPGSKDNGGMYEIQPNGQMVAEFEDWTFSHQEGDTGIIKTTFGYHIMKLDSIHNTLDSQRETIEDAYKSNEYQQVLAEAMDSGEYTIEIKDGLDDF